MSSFKDSPLSFFTVTTVYNTVITTSPPSRTPIALGYRTAVTVVLVLVIVLTVCGNLLTMVVMLYDKRLRAHRVSSLYIASLAGADLLVGAVVMTFMLLYTITYNGRWVFGGVTCAVWTCIDYVSCTASLSNVFLIAVDRYRSVSQPLKAIRRRTRRRASWMLLFAWITPAAFWITIICSGRMLRGGGGKATNVDDVMNNVTWDLRSFTLRSFEDDSEICDTQWNPPELAVITVILMFYIPLLAIFVLFGLIMCVLRRHMNTITRRMRRTLSVGMEQSDDDFRGGRKGGVAVVVDTDSVTSENALRVNSVSTLGVRGETLTDGVKTTTGSGNGGGERISMRVHVYHKSSDVRSFTGGSQSSQVTTFVKFTSRVSVKNLGGGGGDRRSGERISTTFRLGSSLGADARSESEEETSFGSHGRHDGGGRRDCGGAAANCRTAVPQHYDEPTAPHYHRYASDMRDRRQGSLQEVRLRQQIKAAKILGAMTGFLLLCWMPFSVMLAIKAFCPSCLSQRTFDVAIWINYMNSGINPIIYCLCNSQYRLALRNLAKRLFSACMRQRRHICCLKET